MGRNRNEGIRTRRTIEGETREKRTLWFRRWPVVTSPVEQSRIDSVARDRRKEDAGRTEQRRERTVKKRRRDRKRERERERERVGRETEPSCPRNRFSPLSVAWYDCRAGQVSSSLSLSLSLFLSLYLRDTALRVIRGLCSPRSAGLLAIGPCTCL